MADQDETISSTGGRYDLVRYAVRNDGEAYDRLQLRSDGSIFTGDGSVPPTEFSGGGGGGGSTGQMSGSVTVAELLDDNGGDFVDFTGAALTVDDSIATSDSTSFLVAAAGYYAFTIETVFFGVESTPDGSYNEADIISDVQGMPIRNKIPAITSADATILSSSVTAHLGAGKRVGVQLTQKSGVTKTDVTVTFTLTKLS